MQERTSPISKLRQMEKSQDAGQAGMPLQGQMKLLTY